MLNNLSESLFKQFDALCSRLSPENLHCDGEISRTEAKRRHTQIMREWRALEKQAGRKVTQEEIESAIIERYHS